MLVTHEKSKKTEGDSNEKTIYSRAVHQNRKRARSSEKTSDIIHEHYISEQTYYRWNSKYSGMDAQDAKILNQLEEEKKRLKELVVDLRLDNKVMKDIVSKN